MHHFGIKDRYINYACDFFWRRATGTNSIIGSSLFNIVTSMYCSEEGVFPF